MWILSFDFIFTIISRCQCSREANAYQIGMNPKVKQPFCFGNKSTYLLLREHWNDSQCSCAYLLQAQSYKKKIISNNFPDDHRRQFKTHLLLESYHLNRKKAPLIYSDEQQDLRKGSNNIIRINQKWPGDGCLLIHRKERNNGCKLSLRRIPLRDVDQPSSHPILHFKTPNQ